MNQATSPRARGALFTTSNGGSFRLSANDGSGQPTLFNTSNEFSTFSPQRLFGVEGGNVFDITFRDPTNPTQVRCSVAYAQPRARWLAWRVWGSVVAGLVLLYG